MYRLLHNIIIYSFYLIFFFVPFIFSPFNSELFELPKMFLVYVLATVITGVWAIKSIVAGRIIFKRTFLDIPLLLFLFSQVLSTIFSVDIHTSIFGYYSRLNGGLLSLISYCLLYWAFVSNIDNKKARIIIILLLFSATLISIYAVLEHFGVSISCLLLKGELSANCWVQNVQERVFATLGQPNWLAAFLVAALPLAWSKLLGKNKNVFWMIVSILLFAALLFTKSRSGFLGFSFAFFLFWGIYVLKTAGNMPHVLFSLLPFYLLLVLVFGTPWTKPISQLLRQNETSNTQQTTNQAQESQVSESGDIRRVVWKGAIDIWKANLILGTGPETFAYSYYKFRPIEHNLTSEWELLYNKAHNEYLNYLANTGIVGLASYLALILSFIFWSRNLPLLAGYCGILVTNFFGFSVVVTSLAFFLYPAMAMVARDEKHPALDVISKFNIKTGIYLSLVLLSTSYVLLRIAQFWYADTLYAQATSLNSDWKGAEAFQLLEKAIRVNPWEPRYYNELSDSYSILEAAGLSKTYSDKALSISPYNTTFWNTRAVNFKRLAGVDSQYLNLAIEALEHAIKLAPTEPKIHYNLGVLYDHKGDKQKAKEIIEKALELKPNYEDAKEALEKLER